MLGGLKQPFRRVADHIAFKVGLSNSLKRRESDSFDLNDLRWLMAGAESVRFIDRHMATTRQFSSDLDLLTHALTGRIEGAVLEFGVASGRTIRHIADVAGQTVHGFDSFEGLPEDWTPDLPKGSFAQPSPDVGENVQFWKGWFDDSLPRFIASDAARKAGQVAVIHVDCDLYSSTRTVLSGLAYLMRPGTRIVFDEYFNYPGWRQHEYKAFREFCDQHAVSFTYTGYVPSHQQVAVEITAIRKPVGPPAGVQTRAEIRDVTSV